MEQRPDRLIRAGILGCGRVAQHYASIFSGSRAPDNITIVACCDLLAERAEATAAHFGASSYTDLEAMLAEAGLDVVLILTESGKHAAHAEAALGAGVNVIVEKPVVLRPDEADRLAAIAQLRGLMYGTVFQNRFNPAVRALKHAYDQGRFGRIVTATIRLRWCRLQSYYEDGWHGTWAQDGGVINQQAIHHVDALNWIVGPITRVCALMGNRLNELEAEDTMTGIVEFANGALGTLEATTAARPEDFEASLSIVGERGMAVVGGIALNKIDMWRFIDEEPGDAALPALASEDVPTGYGLSHGPYLQELGDRLLRGETAAPISAAEGARAVKLVHALYASIERDGWVRLSDNPMSQRLGCNISAAGEILLGRRAV